MSRHRFVRNLTEDDYYDDYDDDYYDDDYYDEEEDEYRKNNNSVAPTKTSSSSTARTAAPTPPATSYPTTTKSTTINTQTPSISEESIRLVVGMGFPRDKATEALKSSNGNAEQAVNRLLLGSDPTPSPPSTKGIQQPPPGFGKPTTAKATNQKSPPSLQQSKGKSGVAEPPPGFTKPGGVMAPPAGFTKPKNIPAVKGPNTTTPTNETNNTKKQASKKKKKVFPSYENYSSTLSKTRLQELNSHKSRLAMVVLGHVDAGKSTLMGQVLVQIGQVNARTVTKYKKQAAELGKASFALAWVMDEDDSERERGVTMDVATKSFATQNHDFTILDAPGHDDFLPSLITGAAAADVGLLVVPAAQGEFEAAWQNSIQQHVVLARGLGISQLVVAVNKLDAVEWSQERFRAIRTKLLPNLQNNGGFNEKRIQFIPVSAWKGINVQKKPPSDCPLSKWYNGLTLLQAINAFQPASRKYDKPLRIIVNDVCAEGKGVTVRGRVVQGITEVGEKLVVSPVGDQTTIYKLEKTSTDVIDYAMAGDTVWLGLAGLDIVRISAGHILSHSQWRPPLVKKLRAKVLVMQGLVVPIIPGAQTVWHMHSMDLPAVVSKLLSSTQKGTTRNKPRALTSGVSATVEITVAERICVETYNDCRAMGRFVLRRGGETIAIGLIEELLA